MPLKQNWKNEQTGEPYPELHVLTLSVAFYFDDDGTVVRAWIVVDLYRNASAFAERLQPIRSDIGYGVDDPKIIKTALESKAWMSGNVSGVAEALLKASQPAFTNAEQVAAVKKVEAPVEAVKPATKG